MCGLFPTIDVSALSAEQVNLHALVSKELKSIDEVRKGVQAILAEHISHDDTTVGLVRCDASVSFIP